MDFTNITDDQLLQLIKVTMAEAVKRGVAIAKAAHHIHEDAAEELRIKAEIAARTAQEAEENRLKEIKRKAEKEAKSEQLQKEQAALANTWGHKSAVVEALVSEVKKLSPGWGKQLEEGFELNLWARGADVRLYIQQGTKRGWEVVVYLGGNQYNPPGSIEGLEDAKFTKKAVLNFAQYFQSRWNVGAKISSSSVLNYDASPENLEKYISAIKAGQLVAEKESQAVEAVGVR